MEDNNVPKWFILLLAIMLLPLWPITNELYSASMYAGNSEIQILGKLFPVFVVAGIICSYFAYRRDKILSWIIVILMIMSYTGVYWWSSVIK